MEKEIKELQDKLDALKLRYEQSKQPFKNGDVVEIIDEYGISIILLTKVDGNTGFGYGFINNKWYESKRIVFRDIGWTLATSEEWLEALTKEAVKRGFKSGVTCLFGTIKIQRQLNHTCNYRLKGNNVFAVENDILMQDGIWAEVIKEETLEELAVRFYEFWSKSMNSSIEDYKTFFNENKETINRLSK